MCIRDTYTPGLFPQQDFGFATYPWTYPPTHRELDGIVVNYHMFGGQEEGTMDYDMYFRYNQGDWLIRLIGNYFGLFRTYEFGCDYGDLIDDTPKQNNGPGIGLCEEWLDTCPDDPGNDPIHNYMSLSGDECVYEFTAGQMERIIQNLAIYRSSLIGDSHSYTIQDSSGDGDI